MENLYFTANDVEKDRLSAIERGLLVAFAICVFLFGAITEMRSAFLERHHTDAGVYFRAAWALQHHQSIYQITDDNGWHYQYPPLLAALLGPLADPSREALQAEQGFRVPYAISIAIWYVIGVAAAFLSVHVLAKAVEEFASSPQLRHPPPFGRRWWTLRLWPIFVCLPPLGHTLGHGQVNTVVLLCIAAMAAWFACRTFEPGFGFRSPSPSSSFPSIYCWSRSGEEIGHVFWHLPQESSFARWWCR